MCILCDNWEATACSKRPTTDISTNTGHELMLLGYYLGAMSMGQTELPILCPAHEGILQQIADFKDTQAAAQAALAAQAPPQHAINIQEGYKARIAKLNLPPAEQPKPMPPRFSVQDLVNRALPGNTGPIAPVVGATTQGPVIQPIPPAPGIDPTFKFECPNCKKMVTNGEIHDCVYTP